tara:strand:- start:2583 stop:2747 length:165 start_codon:yes stop_codon:yes gene_type:complete
MSNFIEYQGLLWEIEEIKGKKVILKAPNNYLVFNKESKRRIVTKKELGIKNKKL